MHVRLGLLIVGQFSQDLKETLVYNSPYRILECFFLHFHNFFLHFYRKSKNTFYPLYFFSFSAASLFTFPYFKSYNLNYTIGLCNSKYKWITQSKIQKKCILDYTIQNVQFEIHILKRYFGIFSFQLRMQEEKHGGARRSS